MTTLKRKLYGWIKTDANIYRECYTQYGGSINTHPDIIDFIVNKSGATVEYFIKTRNKKIIGAYPLVNGKLGAMVNNIYPISYDEVLIPLSPGQKILFPEKTNRLSPLHINEFFNVNYRVARKNKICIAKNDFSVKSEKNRRNEFNRFIKSGGSVIEQSELSAEELANIYVSLFKARFKDSVRCYSLNNMTDIIRELRHLVFGHVLYIDGQPCAMDLILKTECEHFIYFDVPNGGVEPRYSHLSPGSVLMWLNIRSARELCNAKNKSMRFSIGALRPHWNYKLRWADAVKTGKPLF